MVASSEVISHKDLFSRAQQRFVKLEASRIPADAKMPSFDWFKKQFWPC